MIHVIESNDEWLIHATICYELNKYNYLQEKASQS